MLCFSGASFNYASVSREMLLNIHDGATIILGHKKTNLAVVIYRECDSGEAPVTHRTAHSNTHKLLRAKISHECQILAAAPEGGTQESPSVSL